MESEVSAAQALRVYYSSPDFFTGPEWTLKVLCIVVCGCAAALLALPAGACAGAAAAPAAAAAALLALLLLAAARVPAAAPIAWLLTDAVAGTAAGAALLAAAVLSLVFCGHHVAVATVLGGLGPSGAALALCSAWVSLRKALRRVDAARPRAEPRRPPPPDQDA